MEKDEVLLELKKLHKTRTAFYEFLDSSIKKNENGIGYDFTSEQSLDAKTVYENFYKLDYQSRKLAGILVKTYDIKF